MGDNLYQCNKCETTFEEKEVKLIPYIDNVEVYGGDFITYNIITKELSRKLIKDLVEGDCCLVCPYCDQSHPFGFDKVVKP